ncbi:hypothetical protein GCM10027162_51810 [Streptomyces incanus]
MQGEDGLDEAGDAGGRAPELAEEPPGLEGGHGLFNECADLRVGPVDSLLADGKGLPKSPARDADRAAGTPVALVGPACGVGLGKRVDDTVFADRTDVMDGVGQGR